ncbi:hypothetical protein K438DRAFT_1415128, partial [Mycena galopus ATCC 62051]
RLQLLSSSLTDRYRKLGNLKDLDAALEKDQEVEDLTPEGDPDRAENLRSFAVSLAERYHRLGNLQDLDAALEKKQKALDLIPE